ncbi:hypothetical protein [Cesiribacter sp. SM1]|uniref:hypothetical protein n=1 Tax=Cesiribacter sp. SM1 TaxID=2861196 RepID=UPI001CD47B72|nr:hypothetical protein [Cesiribacter sp. SM1]
MNNKMLGTLALVGAPWLLIGTVVEDQFPALELKDSWWSGVWGIMYISGWMFSMLGLQRIKATGNSLFGKVILRVVLASLTLANVSNVMRFFLVPEYPGYFYFFDFCWPISNILMLVVGTMVIVSKGLPGWKRYVPLVVGLWLPIVVSISELLNFGMGPVTFNVYIFYSAIAWSVLALIVMTTAVQPASPVYRGSQDLESSASSAKVSKPLSV